MGSGSISEGSEDVARRVSARAAASAVSLPSRHLSRSPYYRSRRGGPEVVAILKDAIRKVRNVPLFNVSAGPSPVGDDDSRLLVRGC